MALVCGIEEAGRGPVIGPLVMAGVVIDEKDEDKLVSMGVRDSKQLSPRQREALFDRIKETAKQFEIIIIYPKEIDDVLESEDLNLNWLEAIKSAQLIESLRCDKVILDCPSTNIEAYTDYVNKLLKKKVKVIAEHKADENYPVVSAASILAKVTRDREIENIKKEIGKNFGSGYPSDPVTIGFLKKHYKDYPKIFRKTWQTYKAVAEGKKQKKIGEF